MRNVLLGGFLRPEESYDQRGWGSLSMELVGQGSYRQLAEEIGEVLQAAAETAEKMQEEARLQAARIRGEAEEELRIAFGDGRRIIDEARMEADMLRAEAEWQAQEIIAQARRQAADRLAGVDNRLADLEVAESRVMDRLAGVGQVLAETMASLRQGPVATSPFTAGLPDAYPSDDTVADDADQPTAKIYFVEFPPAAPPAPAADAPPAVDAPADPQAEIILSDDPGASVFVSDEEHSEWAPPSDDLPTWWTQDGAQPAWWTRDGAQG